MHESLLRLDFKRCRVAIAADRYRIDIASPIQIGADYQRSCSRWVADAYRPLEVILVGLRHFPEEYRVLGQRGPRSQRVSSTSCLNQLRAAQQFGHLTCSPTE